MSRKLKKKGKNNRQKKITNAKYDALFKRDHKQKDEEDREKITDGEYPKVCVNLQTDVR